MLSEGKTGKYLKYAIGEILLVVIGILIAIQIKGWNEQVKKDKEELKMLLEINIAIEQDLNDITSNIEWQSKSMLSCNTLLKVFKTNMSYNDSLDIHFGQMSNYSNFLVNLGAYETLKSKGIDLISNDSLRISLLSYYEKDIKLAFAFEETNESIYPITVEMYYNKFDSWRFLKSAKPRNFELLKVDEKFKSYLHATASFRDKEITMFKRLKSKCFDLNNLIKEELKNTN